MSERLKSFEKLSPWSPKGKLDALAARVDAHLAPAHRVGPFPSAPPDYPDATLWDKGLAYAVAAMVYDASGAYYRCIVAAPAGTALTDARYWFYHMPNWTNHMNLVRAAAAGVLDAAVSAAGCGAGETLMESCVVSGPWEVPALAIEMPGGRSGIRLTRDFAAWDTYGTWSYFQPYGFRDLELLSPVAGAVLNFGTGVHAMSCGYAFSYPTEGSHWGFRLRLSFGTGAYVSGVVTCEVEGFDPITVTHNATSATHSVNGWSLRWVFEGYLPEIYCEVEAAGAQDTEGDGHWGWVNRITQPPWTDIISVTWPGQAAVEAHNVISSQPIYRSLPPTPLPRGKLTVYEVDEDGVLQSYFNADGANFLEIYALPGGMGTSEIPPYRLRGRTYPAQNIHYSIGPVSPPDLLEQREWYPCLPEAATRTIPLRSAQTLVREIDTLWAHRALSEADQSVPVVSLTESAVTRPALAADVGYRRPLEDPAGALHALTTIAIPANQMRVEKYLGRAAAILVWDGPYPLRWTGTALWVEANMLLGADVPCAANLWTWSAGWSLGFFYVASAGLDDLNAILDALA